MGNTDDKQVDMNNAIPRNPKTPASDEEIKELLRKASQQIAEKEKTLKKDVEKGSDKNSEKKDSALSSKERENIDLIAKKKAAEKAKLEEAAKKIATDKAKAEEAKKAAEKAKLEEAAKKIATDKAKAEEAKKAAEKAKLEETAKKIAEDKAKAEEAKKTVDKTKLEEVATGKSKSSAVRKDADKKDNAKATDKDGKGTSASKDSKMPEFKVEDDIYVSQRKPPVAKNYKMTVGDIIGAVFEGIWTAVKLMVVVFTVTAIVGFFLSRDLMIRGRSGEQISKQGMSIAAQALSGKTATKKEAKLWSQEVDFEKLTMETDDGKILVARQYVIDETGDEWVVILHGQNGSMEDIYDIAYRYSEEGYNVLMPDLRANGESEGSYFGMGWLDRLDVINWIDVVLEENPSANVAIHGVDLGAATALMLSGEPLKDSVKVIVAEGAYTSAWDAVKTEYKTRHEKWPTFPAVHMLSAVAKVWGGYSLTEADAVEQVRKTSVPILLIHGANDTYVTAEMTEELNQAIASEHEVLTVATGTHEDCRFAEPDTYYTKVFDFVERHIDKDNKK